jgi:hypothetical protein
MALRDSRAPLRLEAELIAGDQQGAIEPGQDTEVTLSLTVDRGCATLSGTVGRPEKESPDGVQGDCLGGVVDEAVCGSCVWGQTVRRGLGARCTRRAKSCLTRHRLARVVLGHTVPRVEN